MKRFLLWAAKAPYRAFGPIEGNDRNPDGDVRARIRWWWILAGVVLEHVAIWDIDRWEIRIPVKIAIAVAVFAVATRFTRRPVEQVRIVPKSGLGVVFQLPKDHADNLIKYVNLTERIDG